MCHACDYDCCADTAEEGCGCNECFEPDCWVDQDPGDEEDEPEEEPIEEDAYGYG